jgi:hypothetical protein
MTWPDLPPLPTDPVPAETTSKISTSAVDASSLTTALPISCRTRYFASVPTNGCPKSLEPIPTNIATRIVTTTTPTGVTVTPSSSEAVVNQISMTGFGGLMFMVWIGILLSIMAGVEGMYDQLLYMGLPAALFLPEMIPVRVRKAGCRRIISSLSAISLYQLLPFR